MAHYAILDENNIVLEVIVGVDETEDAPEGHDDWESFYSSVKGDKTVKRTSYNTLLGEHSDGKTPWYKNVRIVTIDGSIERTMNKVNELIDLI